MSHYVLDEGQAGRRPRRHEGRDAGPRVGQGAATSRFIGETTGETDEFGLPVRYNWAAEYRGSGKVVYGHTPVPEPEWLNRTINIDTGCVFGGKLTALRYPEKEFGFGARPSRPTASRLGPSCRRADRLPALTAQQAHDDHARHSRTCCGKRIDHHATAPKVTIREENATAALEVMSRFAANPKWLIYLPPTMSPTETTKARRPARASGRGVRLLPQQRRRARWSAKKSTWDLARSSWCAGTRMPPESDSAL